VAPEDIPGRRVIAGGSAEPLVTRTVERATGRVRWLRTRARRLDDEGPLSVNIVEDVSDLYGSSG
jgi:hypothetical protein